MSEIFDLELKNIQKQLKKQEKEMLETAENSFCPVCNVSMKDGGLVGVRGQQGDNEKYNGDYCMRCYGVFIAKNIPKYEVRDLPKG